MHRSPQWRLKFALVSTPDGTSLEKGISNVNSQGVTGKATVTTRFGSHDDVKIKMLCEIIMRGSETVKVMDCDKTNDQQWSRVVPDSFDVRTA